VGAADRYPTILVRVRVRNRLKQEVAITMSRTTIDHLIINSPYEEPKYHWRYDREMHTFDLVESRLFLVDSEAIL